MTRAGHLVIASSGVLAVYAFAAVLVGTQAFAQAPGPLGVGLTLDLTVTATLFVYLVAVRPGHLPAIALVPVFAGGLLAVRLLLPEEGRVALALAGVAWGLFELGLAALLVARVPRVVRHFRARRRDGLSRLDALEEALTGILGSRRLAGFLATELAVLAYGVGGWFRPSAVDAGERFTIHRLRAWSLIAATLGFLVIVETAGVHILLLRVSPLAAWLATAGSIYSLLWLAGDAHALRLRSIRVTPSALELHVGLRWRATISRAAIRSVTAIAGKLPRSEDLLACELLWPNVLVTLTHPVVIRGLLGRERTVRSLTLSVDRQIDFSARLGQLPDPTRGL